MDINSLLSPSDDSPPAVSPHTRPSLAPSNSASSIASVTSSSSQYRRSTPPPQQPQQVDEPMTDAPAADSPAADDDDDAAAAAVEPFTDDDHNELRELMETLVRQPYQYQVHQKCIALLRRAFLGAQKRNRNVLLLELRKAREDMLDKFPLKEVMWLEWIQDEWSEAVGLEGRLFVMELCGRSVVDQVASSKLWKAYAEFVETQQRDAHTPGKDLEMSPEEADGFRDLFQHDVVIDTWRQGAHATKDDIADSHELWDRYRDLVMQDLEKTPTAAKIDFVYDVYKDRLKVPHVNIGDTFSAFSTFVTQYDNANYEQIMVGYNKLYAAASAKFSDREIYELRLKREVDANPEPTADEWATWSEYLKWETTQPKKNLDNDMASSLYERCLLRFGEQAQVWEDYVYFILEKANSTPRTISLLQRATRHCPWSGALWAQYIIALEKGFKPFEAVSEVKHRATKTELLDLGGTEEVLKVNIAWCGFLKRRAFEADAGEEDFDMAEMGISEAVSEISAKDPSHKDPHYRIQRIQIGFYTHAKKLEQARNIWKQLAKEFSPSYEFWLRYYEWELANGSSEAAGAVIKHAVGAKNLDWQEKILDTWRNHVQDCGDVNEVEMMMVRYRKISLEIAEKRQAEALEQQAAYAQQQAQEAPAATTEAPPSASKEKRKREEAEGVEDHLAKKAKPEKEDEKAQEDTPMPTVAIPDQPPSAEQLAKRDRENTTVIVRNLPAGYPQVKLRQFFRDCGTINSLKIVDEKDGDSATATVEFDQKEDTLAAQTKDGKLIDERAVQVQIGTGSTLYVTNFPPIADAQYIRDLFSPCGEIVDIRFPSLKYNQHRRFCYVQFSSSAEAQAATSLHGRQLGPKESLIALISAPNLRKSRTGPTEEGREIFIRQLDFAVNEKDLHAIFDQFGKIEKIRLPPGPKRGQHKGFGFIVFTSKEAAEAALQASGTELKTRKIDVSIAKTNPTKVKGGNVVDLLNNTNNDADAEQNGAGSPPPPSFETIKTKTLGIMNLPDTINDLRVHSLFAPFGPLRKVTLRPDHSGAIVEYEHVADAGKASLQLDGSSVDGHTIRIGSLAEMMKQRPEKKVSKGFAPRSTQMMPRSQAVAGRGGRKRGLGFAGSVTKKDHKDPSGDAEAAATKEGGGKSNEDFKKLFLKSA